MMTICKRMKQQHSYTMLAGIAAFLMVLLVYISMGIFPFGENCVLRIDMYHQYAPFHEELRYRILHGKSLLYSFESGLGKNLIAQIAYYTASPFSLLVLFFPQRYISECMMCLICLKICLSAMSFAFCLQEKYDKKEGSVVIFSLFYAFSAFILAFYWNVMWLDAIYLFPLIYVGLLRLIQKRHWSLYVLSLAVCMISNFYIASIVCVFISLLFIMETISYYSLHRDKKQMMSVFLLFVAVSILAAAMASFILLPTFYTLRNTASFSSSFPKSLKLYFPLQDYLPAHFMLVKPKVLVRNESLPNIYAGIPVFILGCFYFSLPQIKAKEKIANFLLLLFMFLCFYINYLDYIIHGFHFPANLPHRFSFIYIFVFIHLAFQSYQHREKIPILSVVIIIILIALYLIYNEKKEFRVDLDPVLSFWPLVINVSFLIAYAILFVCIRQKGKIKQRSMALLLILALTEIALSSLQGFQATGSTKRSDYISHIKPFHRLQIRNSVDTKKLERIEFSRFHAINHGSLYHYPGLSFFSSVANGQTSSFIRSLGLSASSNSYRYYDPTSLIDSLFNIQYIYSKDKKLRNEHYQEVDFEDNLYLYRNRYPTAPGFLLPSEFLEWEVPHGSPFDVQNSFAKVIGENAAMFFDLPLKEIEGEYITLHDAGPGHYRYTVQEEENLDKIPMIKGSVFVPEKGHVYVYIDSPNSGQVSLLFENGNKERRELSSSRSLLDLGIIPSQTINFSMELSKKGIDEKKWRKNANVKIYAASYDLQAFEKTYEKLMEEPLVIHSFQDTRIKAFVHAKADAALFTSIPYDEGWKVLVDGVKIDTKQYAKHGFLLFPVSKGPHEIEFLFCPRGWISGVIFSVIACCIFLYCRKKQHKHSITHEDNL